jgi:hypothetical protein
MELVIVVAGVIIALAAQQWAQEKSSERRAVAADRRVRAELQITILHGVERIALGRCLQSRLTTLARGLSVGRSDWNDLLMDKSAGLPMAFKRIYRVPDRNWRDTEYQGSLANGDLGSLDAERISLIADMYAQLRSQQASNEEELQLANELGSLQFEQPLSPADRVRLLAKLVRLDMLNSTMFLVAKQQIEVFHRLEYGIDGKELTEARAANFWPKRVAEMRSIYGTCVDANAIAAFDRRLLQ